MGKATIVSGGTDGNYTIKMDYGKEVRDGRVTKVNAALAEIGPKITEALGNLNTQEIIEGGAVADVEAAINAYVAATQAIPLAYQAIDVARANVNLAQATLDNILVAPTGTLPGVSAMQAALPDVLTAQMTADSRNARTATESALDSATAAYAEFSATQGEFDAMGGAFIALQSVAQAATEALVAARRSGAGVAAATTAYNAATDASSGGTMELTGAMVGLVGAFDGIEVANLAMQGAQEAQATIDGEVLGAAGDYVQNGQALLVAYTAGGEGSDDIKGGVKANLDALQSRYAAEATRGQALIDNRDGAHSALDGEEGGSQSALSALEDEAAAMLAAANVLSVKRDDYVASALLAPEAFEAAAAAYAAASADYADAATAFGEKYTDHLAAHDALALSFSEAQEGALLAFVGLDDLMQAGADYAAFAQPALSAFTLTPAAIDLARDDATANLEAAKASVPAAEAALKSAEAAIKPAIERHAKLASALMNEKARTAQKQIVLDLLNEQKKAMETEESDLSGVEPEETMQAWCADFTENGTGEVGTIEVPGENAHVLIAPGAVAHSGAYGNLAARELMSPEQVFFNAAILPGWQKFKPTFRCGTITALDDDANTAGVTFDDDKSSAQELGINRYPSLQGIPVEYMSCNAAAFAVGDKCLVRFDGQDWSTPKVIGFASNPKPCMPNVTIEIYMAQPVGVKIGEVEFMQVVYDSDGGLLLQIQGQLDGYVPEYTLDIHTWTHSLKARFYELSSVPGMSRSEANATYPVNIDPTVLDQYDSGTGSPVSGPWHERYSGNGFVSDAIHVSTQMSGTARAANSDGSMYYATGPYGVETTWGAHSVVTMQNWMESNGIETPAVSVTYKGKTYSYEFDRYSSASRTDLLIYKPRKTAPPG